MLWQRKSFDDVSNGEVFRRTNANRLFETAEVMSVSSDRTGIPHVRYRLRVGRPDRPAIDADERTLALSAFLEQYPERV